MTKLIFWCIVTLAFAAILAVAMTYLPDVISFCMEYMKAGIQP